MFRPLTDKKTLWFALVQAGCIGHCVFEYLGDFVTTSGPSMEPTLKTNNLLITERLSKRIQNFDRGDIVIAKNPIDPEMMICKRIMGLPGDKIHLKSRMNLNIFGSTKSKLDTSEKTLKDLSFNDDDDDDDYDNDKSNHIINQDAVRTFRSKIIIVPKGHVWVEGDNSNNSIDSRTYGPIPMGLIQSHVLARLAPDPTML